MYSQGQGCGPEEATIGTIASPSQNSAPNSASSSSPELVELSGPSSSSSSAAEDRRAYARWSNDEEKMLLRLWAEILTALRAGKPEKRGMILRRKWTTNSVPRKQQTSTRSKRKYLVDRYKQAKDWNSKQSGGNRRKSAHYDEIDEVLGCRDIVTLQNVQEAGSVSQESDRNKTTTDASVECDDDAGITSKKEARSARKKTKKREREEEKDDEDREMFKSALSGLESQRSDMNSFVTNFSRMQEQQLTTMNALVGALSKFLEKQ